MIRSFSYMGMMTVVEIIHGEEPERMHDICAYKIKVLGQVDEKDLNTNSPVQMTSVRTKMSTTLLTIHADQSGLIGLMRHLHGRGIVFLSVLCER